LIQQLHGNDLENPDTQYKAAISLGKNLDPLNRQRIVKELMVALEDTKRHGALTRAHAAEALEKAGDLRALPYLKMAALKDDYQLTRSYATRALGKLGDSSVIPDLIHVLKNDAFFGARAEAAESLGKLCKLLESSNEEIQKKFKKQAFRALFAYYEERIDKDTKRSEDRKIRILRETTTSLEELDQSVGLNVVDALQRQNIEVNEDLEKANETIKNLRAILNEINQKSSEKK
jgi:HEAT repeat protein